MEVDGNIVFFNEARGCCKDWMNPKKNLLKTWKEIQKGNVLLISESSSHPCRTQDDREDELIAEFGERRAGIN
ncbi:MAG: hypothetical protein ACLROG_16370 [Coprococcus phoceensis]